MDVTEWEWLKIKHLDDLYSIVSSIFSWDFKLVTLKKPNHHLCYFRHYLVFALARRSKIIGLLIFALVL